MAKYYAVQNGKIPGVYTTWGECQQQTVGFSGAVFKSFPTWDEANNFLAQKGYTSTTIKKTIRQTKRKFVSDEKGIYTDGGQNAITGNEAWGCVTDTNGNCMLEPYVATSLLNDMNIVQKELPVGKRWCIIAKFEGVEYQQNNGAELLAFIAGLRIAILRDDIKTLYSDSQLLIDFWTLDKINREKMDPLKLEFIETAIVLRKQFEAKGGTIVKISGKDNPSDLGWHK